MFVAALAGFAAAAAAALVVYLVIGASAPELLESQGGLQEVLVGGTGEPLGLLLLMVGTIVQLVSSVAVITMVLRQAAEEESLVASVSNALQKAPKVILLWLPLALSLLFRYVPPELLGIILSVLALTVAASFITMAMVSVVTDDSPWGYGVAGRMVAAHPVLILGGVSLSGVLYVALSSQIVSLAPEEGPVAAAAVFASFLLVIPLLAFWLAVYQEASGAVPTQVAKPSAQAATAGATPALAHAHAPAPGPAHAQAAGVAPGAAALQAAPAGPMQVAPASSSAPQQPAAPAAQAPQVMEGALAPGQNAGGWIQLPASGTFRAQLEWSAGPPLSLHISDQQSTWMNLPQPTQTPHTVSLQLEAGQYYVLVADPSNSQGRSYRLTLWLPS